ncbi:phospho-N-acetylmuramoyl-pentapeptide-transferase [Buchnera aphidicola]|uniref:phospho-N-acetylmuramoyl-pentapeptide- transferase n=1 Tax=Buchnera aphidicola TaxID=9 RepID=UPI003BEEF87D
MIFWFNKFSYFYHFNMNVPSTIVIRSILSLFISFFITLFCTLQLIKYFQKSKIFQIIRKNILKKDKIKKNTPTMGGIAIIISIFLSSILFCDLSNIYIWYIIAILLGYGLVGLIDDYLKIKYKNTQGLTIKWKYFLLSFIALIVVYFMYLQGKNTISTQLIIPFYKNFSLQIDYIYIIISYFVIVGTSNAVNFTDGLDGLAIIPIIFLTSGFIIISLCSENLYYLQYINVPYLKNTSELTVFCASIIGSGLGFLWFNAYPAQIFMGDIGSLSLGGILGIIAVLLRQEILLIIMGGIFVVETISVILQIFIFQITKKRLFKMAPIHHHYEIKKYSEPKIVIRFWIISLLLVLIGISLLKVY